MIYIKIIVFCISFIIGLFLIGNYISYLMNFTKSFSRIFCMGFISILVIIQAIAFPFSVFRGSFKIMVTVVSITLIVLLLMSLHCYIYKSKPILRINIEKKNIFLVIILSLLIFLQAFLSSYLYHDDDDDAYYITISSVTINEGEMGLEPIYITSGLDSSMVTHVSHRTDTSTWEYFIAYLSFVFSIEPVILAHTVLPFLLIPLAYMAVYHIASMLADKKQIIYFMIAFSLLNIFGAYAVYSPACFLLLRIWQGKAVLVSIIFPILFGNCLEIIKYKKYDKQYWFYNAMILIGGVSTTIIGVYLTPIYYMMIGIPFLLFIKWNEAKRLLKPIILSLIPCALFAVYSFVQVISTNSRYLTYPAPNWTHIFKLNMLSGYYLILFIIALIYIIIKGNIAHKLILVGTTFLTFITFLNPLFITFVAQKITGVEVYWRLYWGLPIYYAVSFMLSDLICKIKNKLYIVLSLVGITICLNYMGYFMYKEPFYYKHENIYKLPSEVIGIVDYINTTKETEEKQNVLFPELLSAKVRQYSTDVVTMWSRYSNSYDNIIPNTNMQLQSFYFPLYAGDLTDGKYITDNLRNMQVDWLIMPNKTPLPPYEGISKTTSIEEYDVYRIN